MKGRAANLQEIEHHINNQCKNSDEVSMITFFAEKYSILNDQVNQDEALAQLDEANYHCQLRKQFNQQALSVFQEDVEVVL